MSKTLFVLYTGVTWPMRHRFAFAIIMVGIAVFFGYAYYQGLKGLQVATAFH